MSANDVTATAGPARLGYGVVGYGLLAALIPLGASTAFVPWSPYEIDGFAYGLFATIAIAMGLTLPLALGVRRRADWWRRWFVGVSRMLLTAYCLVLVTVLCLSLGLIPLRPGTDQGLVVFVWVALALLIAGGLPAVGALRYALRDSFWRP